MSLLARMLTWGKDDLDKFLDDNDIEWILKTIITERPVTLLMKLVMINRLNKKFLNELVKKTNKEELKEIIKTIVAQEKRFYRITQL